MSCWAVNGVPSSVRTRLGSRFLIPRRRARSEADSLVRLILVIVGHSLFLDGGAVAPALLGKPRGFVGL